MRIMTEREFNQLQVIISLRTGCEMLRNLYEEVRGDIPNELQDSFIELKAVLDDLRNPIFDYVESHTIIPDDSEEEIENEN